MSYYSENASLSHGFLNEKHGPKFVEVHCLVSQNITLFYKMLEICLESLSRLYLLWCPCRYFQMPMGYNPYGYGQYNMPYMPYQATPGQGGYPGAPPAGQPYPAYPQQPPQQQPYYPQQ